MSRRSLPIARELGDGSVAGPLTPLACCDWLDKLQAARSRSLSLHVPPPPPQLFQIPEPQPTYGKQFSTSGSPRQEKCLFQIIRNVSKDIHTLNAQTSSHTYYIRAHTVHPLEPGSIQYTTYSDDLNMPQRVFALV